MLNQQAKLGGYLVGYGVIKKDGRKVEKWLKKPIHNTITKNMLNGLLQFNGDNTLSSVDNDTYFLWMKGPSNATSTRTGVINYGAYGDGTGETSVNDNALKNKTSEYSGNHISGDWYTCSYSIDNDPDNAIYHRVAYQFAAVDTAQDVKEFGVFHRIEPAVEYRMTARVQLEETIHLEVGDAPWFIYEIKVAYTQVSGPVLITGISKWVKKYNNVYSPTIPNDVSKCPYCNVSNTRYKDGSYSGGYRMPLYSTAKLSTSFGGVALESVGAFNSTVNPTGKVSNRELNVDNGSLGDRLTILDYTVDSFKRDCSFIMPVTWQSDANIYAIKFNGDIYQFGDMVDGVFTPSPWHKDYGKELIINARQSYSTDLLTPTA